jgi:hypothetical protein
VSPPLTIKNCSKNQHRLLLNAWNAKLTLATLIWFVVKVPVLSAQITFVQPRTSTEGRFLTMAFFLAIFWVPRARQVVITMGNPSGIAATAKATAICCVRRVSCGIECGSTKGEVRTHLEIIDCTFCPSMMTGIVKVSNIDNPHEDTNSRDDFG